MFFGLESAVDVVAPVFDGDGGVADEGNPALPAVGVTGELEVEIFRASEMIEVVGLVNERESGSAEFLSFPSAGFIRVPSPDGIETGEEEILAIMIDGGAVVMEVGDSS